MPKKSEVFVSTDIEADGPYPGDYSMLSFAGVAFAEDGTVISAFETNLTPLLGAERDERTMREFWSKERVAWEYVTRNPQDPAVAMPKFAEWVEGLPGDLKTMVCMPAGFDFMFMYWYMKKFAHSPFSFSCIDTKSYVMAMRKKPYRHSGKRGWPGRWFAKGCPHTHKAIDDALEQGISFMKMREENLNPVVDQADVLRALQERALTSYRTCDRINLVGERPEGVPVPPIE